MAHFRLLASFLCIISLFACISSKKTSSSNNHNAAVIINQKEALEALKQSLFVSDYSILSPFISDDFSLAGYTGEIVPHLIENIINELRNVISFEIEELNGKKVVVNFELVDLGKLYSEVSFDNFGKFIGISLFHDFYARVPALTDQKRANDLNYFSEGPFEVLDDGLVLVKAKQNGKEQDFIFNFSCSAFVTKTFNETFSGIFNWNDIVCKYDISMAFSDLSSLEQKTSRTIEGIIGRTIVENHIIYLDFETQTFIVTPNLLKFEKVKKIKNKIPFRIKNDLIIIDATIDDETLIFGVDMGRNANFLDSSLMTVFELNTVDDHKDGMEKTIKTDSLFIKKDLVINGTILNEFEFLCKDISSLEKTYAVKLDGLLGLPFLRRKVAINFVEKEMYFLE